MPSVEKKLIALQQCYQQAHATLQVLDAYDSTFSQNGDEKRKRWIEEQRYTAEQKAVANGWEAQYQLKLRMAKLEREAEIGKRYYH